ncbi:MAG: CooT family nickel-binding protein [Spirochaetales bacterium]|nr:CooT family nickel-binding protein [Spirochaetales bacterium]
MCQATVYLDGDVIMEEVIQVNPTAGGIELRTFFGEPRTVPARIRQIDLIQHRIFLESGEEAAK